MAEQAATPIGMTRAAQVVLAERGGPLGYRDILKEALTRRLISPTGRTPERTLYARLHEDLRHNPATPFVLTAPGIFGLKRYPTRDRAKARAELVDWLVDLPTPEWEAVVARLLQKFGLTRLSGGSLAGEGIAHLIGGITLGGVIPFEVSVLALLNRVELGRPAIRALRGSLQPGQAAVALSVGMPEPAAREEALRKSACPVTLVAGDDFLELLLDQGFGPNRDEAVRLVG